jgi:hypothetical protein
MREAAREREARALLDARREKRRALQQTFDRRIARLAVFIDRKFACKRVALGDKPLPKNLPTGPEFLIRAPRAFEVERHALLEVLERFGAQPAQIGQHPHPFFGALTAHEHDRLQWRHLDHHLSQFT